MKAYTLPLMLLVLKKYNCTTQTVNKILLFYTIQSKVPIHRYSDHLFNFIECNSQRFVACERLQILTKQFNMSVHTYSILSMFSSHEMGVDTVLYFRRSQGTGEVNSQQNWKASLLTHSPYAVCFCQLNRLGDISVKRPVLR